MKRIQWIGTSLNAVRGFPPEARSLVGEELRLVQNGVMPVDFKPMLLVGPGVYEVRVQAGKQYRVMYVAKFAASVYVLHAFVKKTQKTAPVDIALAKSRYAALLIERKERKTP